MVGKIGLFLFGFYRKVSLPLHQNEVALSSFSENLVTLNLIDMKKVIVALVLMFGLSLSVFSQDYSVKRGYKGFIDFGYSFNVAMDGFADEISGYDSDKLFWSTSHGYQFNPYLFVGAGFSFDCYTAKTWVTVPFFANIRVTPIIGKLTPFIDAKVGYNGIGYMKGVYFAPSIGCRLGLTRKVGLNFGVGYALQQNTTNQYQWDPLDKFEDETMNHGISIHFGFDF